jgi:hypothetical protein
MDRLQKIIQHVKQHSVIIYQHDAIAINFRILKEVLQNHIDSENILLDIRNECKPATHMDITQKIERHKQEHELFLQKINELEEEFINHIETYDKRHIHKL